MKQFEVTIHEATEEEEIKGALVRSFKINANSKNDAKEWGIKQIVQLKLYPVGEAPPKFRTVMDESGEEFEVQVVGSLLIDATEVMPETEVLEETGSENEETSSLFRAGDAHLASHPRAAWYMPDLN